MIRNKEGIDAKTEKAIKDKTIEILNISRENTVKEYYDSIAQYFPQIIDVVDTIKYMNEKRVEAPKVFYLFIDHTSKLSNDETCGIMMDQFIKPRPGVGDYHFEIFIDPCKEKIFVRDSWTETPHDFQDTSEENLWYITNFAFRFIKNVIEALPKDIEKFNKEVDNIK